MRVAIHAASHAERTPAPAVLDRVRVVEHEAAPVQPVGVVEFRPGEVKEALGIDHEFDVPDFKDGVRLADIAVEAERIRESGATSPFDADPKVLTVYRSSLATRPKATP